MRRPSRRFYFVHPDDQEVYPGTEIFVCERRLRSGALEGVCYFLSESDGETVASSVAVQFAPLPSGCYRVERTSFRVHLERCEDEVIAGRLVERVQTAVRRELAGGRK